MKQEVFEFCNLPHNEIINLLQELNKKDHSKSVLKSQETTDVKEKDLS